MKSCARTRRIPSTQWESGMPISARPVTTMYAHCWKARGVRRLSTQVSLPPRRPNTEVGVPNERGASEVAARDAVSAVRRSAQAIRGAPDDLTRLIDLLGRARFALLGEASHGSEEFYAQRAEITKRLILEKGYTAIAAEADWPD